MKKIPAILITLSLLVLGLVGCSNSPAAAGEKDESENVVSNQEPTDNKAYSAILIVYYSYSGTTQRVAERLQALTSGTLYELTLTNPYTGDSYDVSERVFAQQDAEAMPELAGELPNLSEYDTILIGTPVWNDSMANPIIGYLEQTDFDGKTASLFWTYITNDGTTERDFSEQTQNAQIADGLALRSANGIFDDEMDQMLRNWLNKVIG